MCLFSSPNVLFCGYTIPHPSENKMHLRIETKDIAAIDALRQGLQQLQQLNDHVLSTFEVMLLNGCAVLLKCITINTCFTYIYRVQLQTINQASWNNRASTSKFVKKNTKKDHSS